MATIKDIADIAGVSRGTVDRVLNNRGSVKPETVEKVQKIAKAMNYTPNVAGKILAAKKKNLKFGFVLFSSTSSNPFFLDLVKGINSRAEELKEYGVSVEIRYATIDSPELQIRLIDELVSEGIDGLAITPINHIDIAKKLKELWKKGIPVVTTNSDISDCKRIAYVGSNYYKSGETAAGLINLVCRGDANVGIISGSPLVLCHSERVSGFTDNIRENYPHISIVSTAVNNDDDLESYLVTEKMFKDNRDINALFLAAAGVEGACRALYNLGLIGKIKIISFDTTHITKKLIKKGAIIATIAQQPIIQGSRPLDILFDYLAMDIKPDKEYFYTKIDIKIKENL